MKKMKNRLTAIAAVAFASVLACGVLAGCSSDKGEQQGRAAGADRCRNP